MNPKRLSRLIYLSNKLNGSAPDIPKPLRRYFPEHEILVSARLGAEACAAVLDIDESQVRKMWKLGKEGGAPSVGEYRALISREIVDNVDADDLPMDKKLNIMALVNGFMSVDDASMVAYSRSEIGKIDPKKIKPLVKWETGFGPLDLVTGGMYQGLLVYMASPGQGKTSHMLTTAAEIKKSSPDTRIWFFEQEIPESLMLARMQPLIKKGIFDENDVLICGGLTLHEIREELRGDKNQNRVVFIDSPDTMSGLSAENRRFELGDIYRELVRIKEKSRLVVVASQPRRKDKGNFRLESMAESWEKAWLADMVIGLWRMGSGKYKMHIVKNRFGVNDREVTYHYDLADLSWHTPELEDDYGDEED